MRSTALERPGATTSRRETLARASRVLVNLAGAVGAAYFARASVEFYLRTHSLVGGAFVVEQTWFVIAFMTRRQARAVSGHPAAWLLAAGGTFGGLLLRPDGVRPPWGAGLGLVLQLAGLAVAITALVALGRSFGFVAADRGLVTRGPYAMVRHPIYAGYIVIQSGYLIQFISVRNAVVLTLVTACNVGRVLAEERVLGARSDHESYRQRVRYRLVPGIW